MGKFMPHATVLRKPEGDAAKDGLFFFWSAARRGFSVGAQSHTKTV
jgi:hypothetical protein